VPVAVVRGGNWQRMQRTAALTRLRKPIELRLHLRDALELHVERGAEAGELRFNARINLLTLRHHALGIRSKSIATTAVRSVPFSTRAEQSTMIATSGFRFDFKAEVGVIACSAVAKRTPKKTNPLALRRESDRIIRDAIGALRESVQQLDAARFRHEEMLAMTFRRIAEIQAQVDRFIGKKS